MYAIGLAVCPDLRNDPDFTGLAEEKNAPGGYPTLRTTPPLAGTRPEIYDLKMFTISSRGC